MYSGHETTQHPCIEHTPEDIQRHEAGKKNDNGEKHALSIRPELGAPQGWNDV